MDTIFIAIHNHSPDGAMNKIFTLNAEQHIKQVTLTPLQTEIASSLKKRTAKHCVQPILTENLQLAAVSVEPVIDKNLVVMDVSEEYFNRFCWRINTTTASILRKIHNWVGPVVSVAKLLTQIRQSIKRLSNDVDHILVWISIITSRGITCGRKSRYILIWSHAVISVAESN